MFVFILLYRLFVSPSSVCIFSSSAVNPILSVHSGRDTAGSTDNDNGSPNEKRYWHTSPFRLAIIGYVYT